MTGDNCAVCGECTRYDGHEIAHSCAGGAPASNLPERDHGLVSISEMNRRIAEAEEARDLLWIKHAEAIRLEGIQMFENPMLALAARVALERRRGAKC